LELEAEEELAARRRDILGLEANGMLVDPGYPRLPSGTPTIHAVPERNLQLAGAL
jgi:hypothetical protein